MPVPTVTNMTNTPAPLGRLPAASAAIVVRIVQMHPGGDTLEMAIISDPKALSRGTVPMVWLAKEHAD